MVILVLNAQTREALVTGTCAYGSDYARFALISSLHYCVIKYVFYNI